MEKPILKLSAECKCWPIWVQYRAGDIFENIDPETLPLSSTLKQALTRWSDVFDEQYSLDDPYDALAGKPLDWASFKKEGMRIYQMLCDEVGDRYTVNYPGRK